jgi:hypothetical protein
MVLLKTKFSSPKFGTQRFHQAQIIKNGVAPMLAFRYTSFGCKCFRIRGHFITSNVTKYSRVQV